MNLFVLYISDTAGRNCASQVYTVIQEVFIRNVSLRFYAKSKFCVCFEVHIPVTAFYYWDDFSCCWSENGKNSESLKSVSWTLTEFYFNRGLQRPYTSTCIILQKTINGFLCLLIVFLKSKTHQLNLKDVIKLNGKLR